MKIKFTWAMWLRALLFYIVETVFFLWLARQFQLTTHTVVLACLISVAGFCAGLLTACYAVWRFCGVPMDKGSADMLKDIAGRWARGEVYRAEDFPKQGDSKP